MAEGGGSSVSRYEVEIKTSTVVHRNGWLQKAEGATFVMPLVLQW